MPITYDTKLSGHQAHNLVIEAIKDYIKTSGGKTPSRVKLPWGLAVDLQLLNQDLKALCNGLDVEIKPHTQPDTEFGIIEFS